MFAQAQSQEVRAEEAVIGSTCPQGAQAAIPARPPALTVQPPAISAQTPGHFSQTPAERVPTSWDEEEAQLLRHISALEQQRAEEQFWAERAAHQRVLPLRQRYETLQRSPPLATPAPRVPPAWRYY